MLSAGLFNCRSFQLSRERLSVHPRPGRGSAHSTRLMPLGRTERAAARHVRGSLVPRCPRGGNHQRFPLSPSVPTLLRRLAGSPPQQLTPQAGTPRFARTGNGVWRVAPTLLRGDRPDDRLASAHDVLPSRHDRRLYYRANVPGTCWPTGGAAGCLPRRHRRRDAGSITCVLSRGEG